MKAKKKFMRFLSLLMTVVLTITGMQILPETITAASAEPVQPVNPVGSSDAPEADEILTLGEWQYYINGKTAFIAGYTDENVQNLTIPYNLGGYSVTGIGHNAFSRNTELKWLYVHTNVTTIAADAFAGLSGVTVSAYHGAYALTYAEKTEGLTARLRETNAGFEEGVIDLTGVNPKAYRSLTDDNVVFTASEATFLYEGLIVYFPAQEEYPTGLASIIDKITKSGNDLIVDISRSSFEQTFTSFQGDDELYLDWDNAVYYEGVTPMSDAEAAERGLFHGEYDLKTKKKSSTKTLGITLTIADNFSISGSATITVSSKVNLTVERWLTWFAMTRGTLEITTETTLKGDLRYKGSLVKAVAGGKEEWRRFLKDKKWEKKQTAAEVPFFSAAGFTGTLSVEIVCELSGGFSISYSTKKTERYTLKNGKVNKETLPGISDNLTISMDAKFKIGPQLKASFKWGIAGIASITFFEASIGVFFEATGKASYTPVSGITDQVICLDISYEVYINITLKFGLIQVEFWICKLDFDYANSLSYKIVLIKTTKVHFDGYSIGSMLQGILMSQFLHVNKCNLKERKVRFVCDNGQSDKVETYNVNDSLKNPGTPTKNGYAFQGWYIDGASSGLSTGDQLVLFGSSKMPFLEPGKTLIIRAKWSKYDPVTSISLNRTSISGYSNDPSSYKIDATVNPSYATNKAIKWSSSNTNVATVSSNGTVKLLNAGTATITCTSVDKPNVKATCGVTVLQSVTGIGLNTTNISRYSDNLGTVQLNASISPSSAANKNITWSSSNPAVASVNANGLVTLNGVGNATITCASVSNPAVVGKCQVSILQAVTGINLDKTTVNGYSYAQQTATVTPTVLPSNAANKAVTWSSSDTNVVTVSGDGILTFRGVGTATITCTSISQNYISASCQVIVRQSVTDIELDHDSISKWSDDEDKTVQLHADIGPENAANKSIIWASSNTNVAIVSSEGLVTLKNAGTATISCTSVSNPNVIARCAVTIWRAVDSLALNKTTVERTKDLPGAEQLAVTVYPVDAYNKSVTWASDNESVATVSADGAVTIHNVGTAVVTATSVSTPGKTVSCTFIISHSVIGMSLNQTAISRYSSQTGTVQLQETLEAVEEANRTVFWASDNEEVATVSDTGEVTIHSVGDAMITCTSESNPDVKAQCSVHIMQSVLRIDLDKTEIIVFTNSTEGIQLTPTIYPDDAANKNLIWTSSDTDVISVSDNGYITINDSGLATITCRSESDPDVIAECNVTAKQGVTSVILNEAGINAYSSDTEPILLTYRTLPTDAYDRTVTWQSSNPDVAAVSSTGVVTITGVGSAVITCTSNSNPNVSTECVVEVKQAVESIALNQTTIVCQNSEAAAVQLTADVQPENAVNRDVIWTSSDENVAKVSDTGLVTIAGTGAATITCQSVISPNVKATCEVGVNQAVYALTLNEHEHVCFNDETDPIVLTAIVQPGIAYDKSVTWASSNTNVATVSDSGVVTVHSVGTATITCASVSSPEIMDSCEIIVKRAIEAIFLNENTITLQDTEKAGQQLTATISPANADETDLIWTSSNQDVALVTDTGLVIPTGAGTATITCASARNNDVNATCAVTVVETVSAIEIEGEAERFMPGETIQLTATCYPTTAVDQRVTWTSGDSSIATVDSNGLVTAVGYGTTKIRAASTANEIVYGEYEVTVEHELELETTIEYDTIYPDEENSIEFALVSATPTSAIRMAQMGHDLTWSLKEPTDEVHLESCSTTVMDGGESYQTTYAALYADHITGTGKKTWTVVCTAGDYSAEAEVAINVASANYARSVGIIPPVITIREGEQAFVSDTPQSLDGNPVPEGIHILSIAGNAEYNKHAGETTAENGKLVSFDESGVYATTVYYRAANLMYEVPVTFEVTDAEGQIHYKAEALVLDSDYLQMAEGDTYDLTCEIMPENTYNKAVTWESTDDTVATVDANGHVIALKAGSAAIICTSADGSGVSDLCGVTVESFLQLDESEVEFTVYNSGESRADLGIINVTRDSEARLTENELNVTWSLERISGEASEIAISEFRGTSENGITVSGNQIKLVRIRNAGTDLYKLTCQAGNYSASCMITLNVIEHQLPKTITLNTTTYTGKVETPITVDTTYTCQPADAELPADAIMTIEGRHAFEDALSSLYSYTEPEKLIFEKGGTYQTNVVFSGDNYRYECPITLIVQDEDGTVPDNVTDIMVSKESLYMTAGESVELSAEVVPANASHSAITWTSSDTAVATVSSQGKVTAIDEGIAFIFASVAECDTAGGCIVVVESGLTLQSDRIERTVYLDGITRYPLDKVQLTAASSLRLNGTPPEWKLSRVNNNNLTLKLENYETTDEDGITIYGCSIMLYSASREGDAEYELQCTAGNETVTIPIVIHAVNRDRVLPASVDLIQKVYEGRVNELIKLRPQFIFLPEGTMLPDGIRVDIEGEALFNNALNTEDYYTSQSLSTLSFSRAGLFEANIFFTYSNMRYMVPVTFRIRDESGNVPILTSHLQLSHKALYMLEGETENLIPVFTPANADDQAITWQSSNNAVAVVDANGQVRATGKGKAVISCEPHDSYLSTLYCPVTVEDALTVECGNDEITLYKQGDQICELPGAWLTSGTIYRMKKSGEKPEWSLSRVSGSHTEMMLTVNSDADTATVKTTALLSGGSDIYRLSCATTEQEWTHDFTVNIIDASNAPAQISPRQDHITTTVGSTVNIDFTPVCSPAGSVMPESENMWDTYVGIGQEFYDAVDLEIYDTKGDQVTIAFSKPGCYMLTRQFFINNIHYSEVCDIIVGQAEEKHNFLEMDTDEAVLYLGGKSGIIASASFIDPVLTDVFARKISWELIHVSGNSTVATLKEKENGADLFVVSTSTAGTDVWRIICSFDSYSCSADITLSVEQPRRPVPNSISLTQKKLEGMMGDWLSMPIGVICEPRGSALPESGDTFWTFEVIGRDDVCDWAIADGRLKVRFLRPGYFTGNLKYRAGNFSYTLPVYMTITDEEGILYQPEMSLYLENAANVVFADGMTHTAIGTAMISEGLADYYAGTAPAYLITHKPTWNMRVLSGNAASLSLREADVNTADIILETINGIGEITYRIECQVDGVTYQQDHTLIVSDVDDRKPDVTLGSSTYYATVGEELTIPRELYERSTGDILQGASIWNNESILSVIGYEFSQSDDAWKTIFYETGVFETIVTIQIGNIVYQIPIRIIVRDKDAPEPELPVIRLPKALQIIEDYAFESSDARIIDLTDTRVTTIGTGAFRNCIDLKVAYIPSSVVSIADDAFYGCLNLTIICEEDSEAAQYAQRNNIKVSYK